MSQLSLFPEQLEQDLIVPTLITEFGQLWQLGKHRLLVGDSTNNLQVARLWGGILPKAVITDVPYGISQKSNGLRVLDYGEWDKGDCTSVALNALELCRKVPTITAFCGDSQLSHILNSFDNRTKRTIVWAKPNPSVINGQYVLLPTVELAAHGRLPNAWFGGSCERSLWEGAAPTIRNHPNEKPIGLFQWLTKLTCPVNGVIYDPFLGGGTTVVAAEGLGRICYGMEQSPLYAAIAIERWQHATKQKAILL